MEREFEIRNIWATMKKHIKIIIAIPVILVTIVGLLNLTAVPKYEGTTTVLIGKGNTNDYNAIMANKQLVTTYGELAKGHSVLAEVARIIGPEISEKDLRDNIKVSLVDDTSLLNITITDQYPRRASLLANTVAEVFSKHVLKIMKIDNLSIVEKAVPTSVPVNSFGYSKLFLVGLIGLLVSLFTVALMEYFDNTIRTREEAESILGLPVLAVLPVIPELARKGSNVENRSRRKNLKVA